MYNLIVNNFLCFVVAVRNSMPSQISKFHLKKMKDTLVNFAIGHQSIILENRVDFFLSIPRTFRKCY